MHVSYLGTNASTCTTDVADVNVGDGKHVDYGTDRNAADDAIATTPVV